jgi:acetylornithine deacetylase
MAVDPPGSDVHQRISAVVDARRDEIVSLLADLVRFPSVNRRPYGDELACQQFVAATLRGMGCDVDVFRPDEIPGIETHPGWWPGSDFTDRPNVVGVRHGTAGGRSLLLLAHVDVVPEGPHELWRHGPFNPTIEDGALVGRGSNDDKGGLAAAIMAVACVEAAGYRPRGDVIAASAVDEESAGANGTLAVLLRPHTADAAVYCDGLDLDVHTANLGGVNVEIDLQVRPERAGTTIARVMEIVSAFYADLQQFTAERRAALAADPRYAETVWPDYAVRTGFLQVGSEDGGNPGGARIHTSAYILPGEDIAGMQAHIEQRLRAVAEGYGDLLPPRIAWVGRIMPPSAIPDDHPFVDAVAAAYERATGRAARRRGMPMSDLFQFNLHSPRPMPTVAMGPGRWGEGGAHQANESVLIDEHLIPFVKTLAGLIVDWCGVE